MNGRSQQLQTANPPDDWVDDSWIVDCICGVNFDDGEEMVKCDECGVWVHTRCSHYAKEEELFACDKCKDKKIRNDIEETEVAKVLVELPTRSMTIGSKYVASEPAKKPPLRIRTEMPMEEKVHVQGIPGGDPGLFSGLSSVSSRQLWKCTGCVPKKFNFRYKEFPCWDSDKEDVVNVEDDNENAIAKGSRAQFSLQAERVLVSPVTACMSTGTKGDNVNNDRKACLEEVKKSEVDYVDLTHSQNGARKEKSLRGPVKVYSGKRKKEESGTSKDISGKNKSRIIDKALDANGMTAHASRTVFTPTSDAKQLEFYEDRGAKSFKTDIRSVKNRNLRDSVAVEPISDCRTAVNKRDKIPQHELATIERAQEGSSAELTCNSQDVLVKDKILHNVCAVHTSAEEVASGDGCNSVPQMEVGESCAAGNLNGGSSDKFLDLPEESRTDASAGIEDNQTSLEMNSDKSLAQKCSLKTEVDDDRGGLLNRLSACHPDANSPKISPNTAKSSGVVTEDISGNCNGNYLVASSLRCGYSKSMDVSQNEGDLSACNGQKDDFPVDPQDNKESNDSKILSEPQQISGDGELSKSGLTISSAAPSSRLKVAVSLGKSSSRGSSIVISKSYSSNKSRPSGSEFWEHSSSYTMTGERKHDAMQKTEECSLSLSSRNFHTKVPKGNASDSKNCAVSSSSERSTPQNDPAKIESAKSAHTHNQSPLPAKGRVTASRSSSKVGRSKNTAFHSSLEGNHAAAVHQPVPSNSPAALSDEELALLLHKELNSSPRVPRIPRVRQASLPQLASQAASTLHIKRTSSLVGKDQNLVPRRKDNDSAKGSATHPREPENGARRTGRATSSSDQKRQYRLCIEDASTKEAKGPSDHLQSCEKNASFSNNSANSGPSSSNEAYNTRQLPSLASPSSNSDDDFITDQPPVYHTLPGLINEIISKGRRMTYQELCDAVLPHWPSLQKHNGELYAFPSHSQAVLDCLSNRHEWAHLVDRVPKPDSSRKRRSDFEDFEDDEDSK